MRGKRVKELRKVAKSEVKSRNNYVENTLVRPPRRLSKSSLKFLTKIGKKLVNHMRKPDRHFAAMLFFFRVIMPMKEETV